MKDTAVMNLWSGKLQRRVNIMLRDVERGDSEDYKKKIEGLLKEKLIGSKAVSANGEQEDANKLKAGLRKRITEDL